MASKKKSKPMGPHKIDGVLEPCDLEEIADTNSVEKWEYIPCSKKFRLCPEDEISLDSIFSALLSMVEPTDYKRGVWDIDGKDYYNEKQFLLFEEKLYISRLTNTNCKLTEEHKIFLDRELEEIGKFSLNIEESYDGYVVFSCSNMLKGKGTAQCGHRLKGKYDNKFFVICEKRMEFDHIDGTRIEKSLEVRNKEDHLLAFRETKVSEESQKLKAEVEIRGRDENFLMDGGVMLLMRYLVMTHFTGNYYYYTMNLFGKVLRCTLSVLPERKKVRLFHRDYDSAICITNTQYFDDVVQESSDTFFTINGRMILHYWHGFTYLMHAVRKPEKPPEPIVPKLELMWRADHLLLKHFKTDKKLNYENAMAYLSEHTEVSDFLHDFIYSLLKYKPEHVLEYTIRFFHNMKTTK